MTMKKFIYLIALASLSLTAWSQPSLKLSTYNGTSVDNFDGQQCVVTVDRYIVNGWNTLSLPFAMTEDQMAEYEYNTGVVIVDRFKKGGINPVHTPAVLVKNHGPFAWGKDADQAVYHAVVTEQCAKMATFSFLVNPATTMNPLLVEKHFSRKHGPNAYYGQKKK